MFRQTAYAASSTLNRHDLLFHQLAEAHEDRGDLGAGGIRLRAEETVGTLDETLTDGPLHRGDGPRTDVGSVRKLRQILRERMLLGAKQETSRLLGEDAEERQVRQLIAHKRQ